MKYCRKFISTLFLVVFFGAPLSVFASTQIYFSGNPKQVEEGDRLSVDIKVNSQDQAINAVTGSVIFSSDLLRVVSINKDKSIINFWTVEPKLLRDRVSFEGVVLNPGFQGSAGALFRVTFEAKKAGQADVRFVEGALLANDGLGTNVLVDLGTTSVKIVRAQPVLPQKTVATSLPNIPGKIVALPVITEYPPVFNTTDSFTLRGRGEPGLLTRIVFKDISVKSLGERFIERIQTNKKKLDEVLVKNDINGAFEYVGPKNIVAGVYNATPFLVDEETNLEKPGFGAQLLVSDSKVVRSLVVVINVLGLLIPIVLLCVIIYFIPWYSWLRMRVLRKKIVLEEEKLDISEHQLKHQDKILDQTVDKIVENENKKHE